MEKNEKKQNFQAVFKKYFARKDQIWLLPNQLCFFRIFLVAVFLCFYLIPIHWFNCERTGIYLAAATMCLAAYTDFLDGYIARTFHLTSELGKVLDPGADKLLQCAVACGLCVKLYHFPSLWVMFACFLVKEISLMVEDAVLASHNRSFGQARWYGKVSTFLFYVILASLLLGSPFVLENFADDVPMQHYIIDSLCSIACFLLLGASCGYFLDSIKLLKHGENEVEMPKKEEEDHD